MKNCPTVVKKDVSYAPRYNTKQVFMAEQELSLKNYLITSAKMHFGLTRSAQKPFFSQKGKKWTPTT